MEFPLRRILVGLLVGLLLLTLRGDSRAFFPVRAGLRVSRGRHLSPFPPPSYFQTTARRMTETIPRARPSLIWIVGLYWSDGEMGLSFPRPDTGAYPFMHFASADLNEAYLESFDRTDLAVWLQVEPGDADVDALIDLVLDRYGHHPCVVGFGIDVEWFRRDEGWDGRAITDAEARRWNRRVKRHNPSFRLFLKHYLPSKMPRTERGDILFLNDSQGFPGLRSMAREFRAWGHRFHPAEVGFQYGYPSDRAWWESYRNPAEAITRTLQNDVPNARWFFWVDFSVLRVFPPDDPDGDRQAGKETTLKPPGRRTGATQSGDGASN